MAAELGSAVSLMPGYVKVRGTCHFCKNAGGDPDTVLIKKGELYWSKGLGR